MANLDLNSIWETVKTATSSANGGNLTQSALTNIATSIVTSALGSKASSSSASKSGTDYVAIAKQLYSLYEKYKGSADSVTTAAATNVKSISDIIGAMGGDKSSVASAAASVLGSVLGGKSDSKSDSSSALGSIAGSVLGGLFGKK